MTLLAHTHITILGNVFWGCAAIVLAVAVVRIQWGFMNELRRSFREWRRDRR